MGTSNVRGLFVVSPLYQSLAWDILGEHRRPCMMTLCFVLLLWMIGTRSSYLGWLQLVLGSHLFSVALLGSRQPESRLEAMHTNVGMVLTGSFRIGSVRSLISTACCS